MAFFTLVKNLTFFNFNDFGLGDGEGKNLSASSETSAILANNGLANYWVIASKSKSLLK